MPTYRVTGPDGATYEVTPPEGTNPSESDILAQVQAQATAPTGGGPIPATAFVRTSAPVLRADRDAAARELAQTELPRLRGRARDEAAPSWPSTTPWRRPEMDGPAGDEPVARHPAPGTPQAQAESEATARAIVPQTPAGGAAALAGAAAGPDGLLANILAPAAASGLASLASGNEPLEVAKDTALAAVWAAWARGRSWAEQDPAGAPVDQGAHQRESSPGAPGRHWRDEPRCRAGCE